MLNSYLPLVRVQVFPSMMVPFGVHPECCKKVVHTKRHIHARPIRNRHQHKTGFIPYIKQHTPMYVGLQLETLSRVLDTSTITIYLADIQ